MSHLLNVFFDGAIGTTIVKTAIASGNCSMVRALVELYYSKLSDLQGRGILQVRDTKGNYPLTGRAKLDNPHCVSEIIEFYIDTYPKNCSVWTIDALLSNNYGVGLHTLVNYTGLNGNTLFHTIAAGDGSLIFRAVLKEIQSCQSAARKIYLSTTALGYNLLHSIILANTLSVEFMCILYTHIGEENFAKLVSQKSSEGYTPLYYLCKSPAPQHEVKKCVEFLVDTIGSAKVLEDGKNLMQTATDHGNHSTALYLKDKMEVPKEAEKPTSDEPKTKSATETETPSTEGPETELETTESVTDEVSPTETLCTKDPVTEVPDEVSTSDSIKNAIENDDPSGLYNMETDFHTSNGSNILHMAIEHGSTKCIRVVSQCYTSLTMRTLIKERNHDGKTPIDILRQKLKLGVKG